METIHHKYMREALNLAQEAYDNYEVPVGCVFVLDDKIIGNGRNRTNETHNGTRHAELEAIDIILSSGEYTSEVFQRCVLYVTVEPCVMCAYALRQLRIKHVYYGCANERFGGTGSVFDIHRDPKLTLHPAYSCEGGYYREESILLLRKFYVRENENAPIPKRKHNRVLKTEIVPMKK
ncbi:cytidine deaminase-like protein [Glomus cerebriforme]|uniref:tRNA(adenine(34)) deaminase n=1 Tax=Glomus cerebriforme TaxID=658196 RepID=A0A397TKP8_9GLOM|nr:cytidine deaminase-like protein [Glomus cerebriforme]